MATSPFTGSQWGTGTSTPRVTWSFATMPGELVTFAASISDPAYQSAIRKAFATWESVANIDFVEAADNLANGIRLGWSYIDKAGSTLATANWRYSGTQTTEAEIRFDLDENWRPATGGNGIANFLATAVHEIGHAIGLSHVEDRSSIMYAYQTNVSTLSAEDISHIQSLYGAPAPAATQTVVVPATTSMTDIFRFYNTSTGVHFYTNSAVERDSVQQSLPQFRYEGSAFKVPSDSAAGATTSVYRFFDTQTGAHFYTANTVERDKLQTDASHLRYEGEAFKAFSDAGANGAHHAVHRFWRTDTGTHFYTASEAEKTMVEHTLALFRYEGVAYFAD